MPNIETYLKRQDAALPISQNTKTYRPGDIVTWRLSGNLPHIGIVSDRKARDGTPLIIHNIGQGVVEENMLFKAKINGHSRFVP